MAASLIGLTNGTTIASVFQGPNVSHQVSFPDGASYHAHRMGEARSITVRQNEETILQIAQLRLVNPGVVPVPIVPPPQPRNETDYRYDLILLRAPYALILRSVVELFNAIVAQPQPMGLGEGDLPVIAFKVWTGGTEGETVHLQQETLTREQVAQTCKALPAVQVWTNEAAADHLPSREFMSAKDWGNTVHWAMHDKVKQEQIADPALFSNLFSELTVDEERVDSTDASGPRYGQRGASRLDVVEKVSRDIYCVCDVKTGQSGLTQDRILEILSKLPIGVLVYIME